MTLDDVAAFLGVSYYTARELHHRGELRRGEVRSQQFRQAHTRPERGIRTVHSEACGAVSTFTCDHGTAGALAEAAP